SSRRRHTRLVSDWSSDVCSSDLALLKASPGLREAGIFRRRLQEGLDLEDQREVRVLGPVHQLPRPVLNRLDPRLDLRFRVAVAEIGRASCRERVERWGVAV